MSSQIARRVVDFFQKTAVLEHTKTPLSVREQEILSYLVKDYRYKEIADRLSISLETVRIHIRNIYEKLHVHSRSEGTYDAVSIYGATVIKNASQWEIYYLGASITGTDGLISEQTGDQAPHKAGFSVLMNNIFSIMSSCDRRIQSTGRTVEQNDLCEIFIIIRHLFLKTIL